ncbi:MAG: glycerophosphodiester phosphodiesterase [Candidatus Hatepunaea meridiana]|nr:glycerophosphodiester phosphodiesterase [Candidatus Hatepunaea meridiana]
MKTTLHINKNLLFIAHRGGLYYRPENSIAAVDYIYKQNIHWIESDVRMSKDGIPVLFHDERLHVPGLGNRAVRELHSRDLKKIDVGGGEMIPTLEGLLKRFGDKLSFDFDIKELDAVERVIALIKKFKLEQKIVITSFIPEALQRSLELAPDIKRGFLLDRLTGALVDGQHAVNAALLLKCDFFIPHFKLLSLDWAGTAQAKGLKVMVWTVNRLNDARKLIEMGVCGLISDRPDYLRDKI